MKKTILLLMIIVSAKVLFGQSPSGFSYQAVVRNSEGQPVADQAVGVRLTLENATGDATYFSETHAVNTSPQGVISLTVGTGEPVSGDMESVPWSDGGIHLRVEVDPTGGTSYALLGSTELKSVPYALFAASGNEGSQGEAGLSAYEIWLAMGNTGTEEEFIASLSGSDGQSAYEIWLDDGNTGTIQNFLSSLKGVAGDAGTDGLSAYGVWLSLGNTGTESDFLASLAGTPGADGKSAYDLWIDNGNTGTVTDFIASLKGEEGDPGVGVQSTVDNGDGTFTINYSNGTSFTTVNLTGPQGPMGTSLNNRGEWVQDETYEPGDYVFAPSIPNPLVNSLWILQSETSYPSSIEPSLDTENWVEFEAPQGEQGPEGPQGPQGELGPQGPAGISINWLGSFDAEPQDPTLNQAYYNTVQKKSYVYNGTEWNIISQDGEDGAQGPQGDQGIPGAQGPQGIQGIQGEQGPDGEQGLAGNDGISIQWLGSYTNYPLDPTPNQAFYHQTERKSYVYNGTWQILAQDGLQGLTGVKDLKVLRVLRESPERGWLTWGFG